MSDFKWAEKTTAAALLLAEGHTQQQAADKVGVSRRTVERWVSDIGFAAEVDRLSLMIGISGRAERLRIAMRAVRQKVWDDGTVTTDKDLLDWLKFAQSETDGIKLDLTAVADAQASVAGSGSNRTNRKGKGK
jgi:transcriptional regulator with XRE-family HTH domain